MVLATPTQPKYVVESKSSLLPCGSCNHIAKHVVVAIISLALTLFHATHATTHVLGPRCHLFLPLCFMQLTRCAFLLKGSTHVNIQR